MECIETIKGTPWTEEEIKYLEKNYEHMPAKKLSENLGRPINSVYMRANEMGLKRKYTKVWSDEDREFLRENYKTMNDDELARVLNRSKFSIKSQKSQLGLRKPKEQIYLNFEKVEKNKKNKRNLICDAQLDKSIGLIDAYRGLAMGIVRASIDDLKKDIKALKRIADRGFEKERLKEAVKKVLISEAAFFNDNFPLYLETDPKEIVLVCWDTCKADRNKYLKNNLYLIEDQLGKEFIY